MDAQLGKVIDALKESGQMENTLIVFFGDHGYHLGEQNWWNKFTLYEQANNAPCHRKHDGLKKELQHDEVSFSPQCFLNTDNIGPFLDRYKHDIGNPESPHDDGEHSDKKACDLQNCE